MNDTIRPAQAADSAELADLFGQLGYPDTAAAVAGRLAGLGPHDAVLVACSEGRVIGVVTLHLVVPVHNDGPWGRISALVVDAAARGSGAGARLLRAAEDWCAAHRCTCVELTSGVQRADAHRFYLANGYAERSKRFWKGLRGQSTP